MRWRIHILVIIRDVKNTASFKRIILSLFILMMFLLSACTKSNEASLIGVYHPVSITSSAGDEYEIEDEELHIEEDGKGYFLLHDTKYEIRWTLENGRFHFEDSTGDEFDGSFKDAIIDGIYFDNIRYVFRKKGN